MEESRWRAGNAGLEECSPNPRLRTFNEPFAQAEGLRLRLHEEAVNEERVPIHFIVDQESQDFIRNSGDLNAPAREPDPIELRLEPGRRDGDSGDLDVDPLPKEVAPVDLKPILPIRRGERRNELLKAVRFERYRRKSTVSVTWDAPLFFRYT